MNSPKYGRSVIKYQQNPTATQSHNLQSMSSEPNPSYTPNRSGSPSDDKSSLDFTQRIERKLAEYNASQNVFKKWLFEIMTWLVSALCMATIVAIYIYINQKPMSDFNMAITASNALGKVASAALIVPTSEALGQLKWNWFHNSRAMWDFEIFDKASRGAWGATLLLFRTKGRSLAALGALLMVLMLAIDTFFQQVVEFPDRWALQNTTGAIPRISIYAPSYARVFSQDYAMSQVDKYIRPIGEEYFYSNGTQPVVLGNGTRPDIPLSCPTSRCTWPEYETLAVCSTCADVSDSLNLTYACLNTTIDWSTKYIGPIRDIPFPQGVVCGYFINATSTAPTIMSGYIVSSNATNYTAQEALLVRTLPLTTFMSKIRLYGTGSIKFSSIRNPIMDVLIASAPGGSESVYQKIHPIVHECVLSWCVQSMKSSYEYGKYQETVISAYQNTTAGPSPWVAWKIPEQEGGGYWTEYLENVTIVPPKLRLSGLDPDAADVEYGVKNETAAAIMLGFDDFFPSYYTQLRNTTVPQLRFKEYELGPSKRALSFNPWLAPNNITRHMERLATAMTNAMRSTSSGKTLQGEAYQKENYIKIRWEWLSFPFSLLFLSLVFLVATITKTSSSSETGVWKTSAMPTLIYSLPKEAQGQFTSSSTWGSEKEAPKRTRIKLLPNMGWRISGQSQLSHSPTLLHGERLADGRV